MSEAPTSIRVALADRSYDVLIGRGLLARTAELIDERLGARKCVIVTDANVARHHGAALEAVLRDRGIYAGSEVLSAGEATKSFTSLAQLSERLLAAGLERGDLIVALGGGVIGDLAGFAASILRRGIRFIQVPTSLLAQVDSSVGGKTGINTPQGKNLIGTFHQPSLVLADLDTLDTLPARQFRAGYAEAAKYGLLGDAEFFAWLEQNWQAVFARRTIELGRAVAVSVKGKADIVARDETETGDRMLLNLGHTFGHALEAWAGFSDRLLHGEAVAIGIVLAFRLSHELGLASKDAAARARAHLAAVGLPTTIGEIPGTDRPSVATLMDIMAQDKKVRDGRLTLILARGIGQALVTRDVASDRVGEFLARTLAEAAA